MAFKAYLASGFEYPHENELFASLVRVLNNRFASDPAPHFLIGNVMFDGEELDAVFLKRNAISVIEMKNYGGMIHFSENTEWFADDREVRGGRHPNPFRQVRTYKFALMGCLRQLQSQILSPQREVGWGQVSGVVLFGQPIHFDEQLPHGVGLWFHVSDVDRIADELANLHSPALQLSDSELQTILRLRGFHERHLYSNFLPPGLPLVPPLTEARQTRIQVIVHRESHFRDHELRMRNLGGARSAGAMLVRQLFDEVRQGRDPFSSRTSTVDARVPGARIYQINEVCSLVMIHAGRSLYPFFLGDHTEVQQWLEAYSGLTLAVDGSTNRITPTVITTHVSPDSLPAPSPTAENLPFFSRIKGLDLPSLVPQRYVRRGLEELDEESTNDEVVEVLASVPDEDLRTFLFNVISLIRSADIAGAEARVRLRNGEASPIEDAGALGDDAAMSDANSDQVVVVNNLSKEDLDRLLDPVHFQDWMLFLHPDQKRVAQTVFDGPVVLTGVSGSGKTCILVHRARYLARKYPNERIGVMTLNRSLAKLLQNLVNQLCSEEERRNICVMAFYDYFQELIRLLGPDRYLEQLRQLAPESRRLREAVAGVDEANFANEIDLRSGETAEETWDDFFGCHDPEVQAALSELEKLLSDYHIDPSRYLKEECTLVRSGLALIERTKYLDSDAYPRIGRGSTPQFLAKQRQQMLDVLLLFEEWMIHGAVVDVVELTQALTPLWNEIRQLPTEKRFRCLLVDEFQDLSTLDIRLLCHVPTEKENGLFLTGDTVQRILVKRLKLAEAGLPGKRGDRDRPEIKKNYRNSRQILKAASTLANHYGKLASSQGEEIEVLDPELAQRETNPPIVLQTDNQIRKAWELALECIEGDKITAWTVCIVTAAPEKVTVNDILAQQPENVEADLLSGDCILHPERMVVGTIHDLKGFEFRLVVIVGCDREVLPAPGVPSEEVWRDALRLYVAMTRARDQVYLIYEKEPSEFVIVMGETVVQRQEPIIRDYVVRQRPAPATERRAARPAQVATPARMVPADWYENCESWFAESEVEILKRYFARHVYRDNLTFHEWCKPRILDSLRPELFFALRHGDRRDVQRLLDKLRTKGLRLSPR